MSKFPVNQTWKQQNKKLVKATFKKAFINAVHVSANTVDVYFAENPQTIVRNIRVASTVVIANVQPSQRCRIDVFDETNPSDMVMAYTY